MKEEKLKQLIREAVIEALTVELTWEKRRDEKTGVPLAVPDIRKENVFLPSFLVQQMSFHEGAFRGLQEDVSKRNNLIDRLSGKIEIIGRALLGNVSDAVRMIEESNESIVEGG